MAAQEIIISASSSHTVTTTDSNRPNSTPAIHLHDLLTAQPICSLKNSSSSSQSVSYVPTRPDVGGCVFAVQEGKAIVNVWAWQKDQIHLKLHLPDKLTCFKVSANGCWAAGGSPSGHIYVWELSSGMLRASFTAHYRSVATLTFTSDSRCLLTSSLDASIHVYLISHLVDPEASVPKPYGVLSDHTLAIRDVIVSPSSGQSGGRCWTASEDGTVKLWSLHLPFDLLCTFSFPSGITPCAMVVEPSERFFYVGTANGDVYHISLFKHRGELGSAAAEVLAVGGGSLGAAPVKVDGKVISQPSKITSIALSLSATHLLIGTDVADVLVYDLPSHQYLRTIACHSGPVTNISTLVKPPDLANSANSRSEAYPIMEVKNLERARSKDLTKPQVYMTLRPSAATPTVNSIRPSPQTTFLSSQPSGLGGGEQLAEAMAENKRLREDLDKAVKLNKRMWNGVVELELLKDPKQPLSNGHA